MLQDNETLLRLTKHQDLTAFIECIALTSGTWETQAFDTTTFFLNAQSSLFLKVSASGTWRQRFLKAGLE